MALVGANLEARRGSGRVVPRGGGGGGDCLNHSFRNGGGEPSLSPQRATCINLAPIPGIGGLGKEGKGENREKRTPRGKFQPEPGTHCRFQEKDLNP